MLVQRMIRAALLDSDLYHEVKRDTTLNGQAFGVVLIVLACSLIGFGAFSPGAFLSASVCTILGWLFWSMVAMLVGTRFGGRAEFDEVMRPMGFAHAPGVLYALAGLGGQGLTVGLIAWLWTSVAIVVALRESMRLETSKAIVTMLLTTAIVAAINFVTGTALGAPCLLLNRLGL